MSPRPASSVFCSGACMGWRRRLLPCWSKSCLRSRRFGRRGWRIEGDLLCHSVCRSAALSGGFYGRRSTTQRTSSAGIGCVAMPTTTPGRGPSTICKRFWPSTRRRCESRLTTSQPSRGQTPWRRWWSSRMGSRERPTIGASRSVKSVARTTSLRWRRC